MGKSLIDMTGQTIGELTVIKRAPNKPGSSRARWICKCSCGNTKAMRGDVLRQGVVSCGCKNPAYKHGGCVGEKPTRLYVIWRDMKSRCSDTKNIGYSLYGGRGISVCDEWRNNFETFRNWAQENGYRDDLSIDRIDVDGNYEPANCKWATNKEQQRNKRTTVNITVHGKTKSLGEWAESLGVSYGALLHRRHRGTLQKYLELATAEELKVTE